MKNTIVLSSVLILAAPVSAITDEIIVPRGTVVFGELDERHTWQQPQQRTRRSDDPLAVREVTRIMVGDRDVAIEGRRVRSAAANLRQPLVDVLQLCVPRPRGGKPFRAGKSADTSRN